MLNVTQRPNSDMIRCFAVNLLCIFIFMLRIWGKNFNIRLEIFVLFFQEMGFWHYMQIVSIGDNLHEMTKPIFREYEKNTIN